MIYICWISDEEPEAPVEEPPSLDYVSGPEHLPSPDYVPGLEEPEQAPLSLDYPLPDDDSPTALSPGYIAGSDSKEDPEEDPVEDHADYPVNGGDDDDDDDEEEEEEEQEASEDDDEEDEEHLAPANSFVVPVDDPVPSAEDTEAFETNESAPTPVPSTWLGCPSDPRYRC
ncbi:hypothetical protein Tco_0131245 [Tanacetum coccineum]